MIAFKDVHQTAVDTISAHAYFSGETVLKDLGLAEQSAEDVLSQRGFVVTVLPVLKADKLDQGGKGIVLIDCSVPILIEVNTQANAGANGAGKDIYEAIEKAVSALISYDGDQVPNNRFMFQGLDLVTDDPGEFAYLLQFSKKAQL